MSQTQKLKDIKKLSELKPREKLVFCPRCETFFIDDSRLLGTLACPNEGCGRALSGGFTIKGNIVFDSADRKFKVLG